MFYISVTTPPAVEPVSTATLKTYLHLNTTDEDTLLPGFISTAREQFEHLTQRPVISTGFRQYVDRFAFGRPHLPWGGSSRYWSAPWCVPFFHPSIYLMVGGVTAVSAVQYRQANETYTASSTHTVDLVSFPARVWWTGLPPVSVDQTPVAYVDFTAGWADAGSTPADVQTAIMLLAAHYFGQRSAYITDNLRELPQGFVAVCNKYSTGLEGDWHQ